MFNIDKRKIWVAGHKGMVGSAVVRVLSNYNCSILTVDRDSLDLTRQDKVEQWMQQQKPDAVIICAAKVGGIFANSTQPAEFLYENLVIETNIIHSSYVTDVKKLVFLGSSCIYPKYANQPIKEHELLTGSLEATNEWYSIAKIAGIKLCQAYRKQHGCDFISAMPTNLYGPFDNFDLQTSHVIPALMRKAHEAKIAGAAAMEIWGSGQVKREFMYADDCAKGIIYLLENYSEDEHVNLGTGEELAIKDLALLIKEIVGFEGDLSFNSNYPDGTPRKVLDVSKIKAMGWKHQHDLEEGLKETYEWFLVNQAE